MLWAVVCQVKVKKRGDDQKFLARVLAMGVDCDIALLTVDDEAFWEGITPLEFGPLPKLQDTVAVVGYPIGGDTISVTVGVVSRIEVGQQQQQRPSDQATPCCPQRLTSLFQHVYHPCNPATSCSAMTCVMALE
jgi:hypothetical protein